MSTRSKPQVSKVLMAIEDAQTRALVVGSSPQPGKLPVAPFSNPVNDLLGQAKFLMQRSIEKRKSKDPVHVRAQLFNAATAFGMFSQSDKAGDYDLNMKFAQDLEDAAVHFTDNQT